MLPYKRIIIKVGTKVLSQNDGRLDVGVLKHLVNEIVSLQKKGIEVILVTSGAVGAGKRMLSLARHTDVTQKQVFAAIGQIKLMSIYAELFGKQQMHCAQILVTKEDFRDRAHYLNMQRCFEQLLHAGVLPIVNENDVIATTELLFTDNDELAGLVSSQLNADAIIILTSVDGVLADTTNTGHVHRVSEIALDKINTYEQFITPDKSSFGRGGMLTKFGIAKKLALQGITAHIANGKHPNILTDLMAGKSVGTKFLPRKKLSGIKRRIAYSDGLTKGAVMINTCTKDLLRSKTKIMSLLPIGITGVRGIFAKGDIIEIIGPSREKLGFGIAKYDSQRVKELMGKKRTKAVIHYDHMFIND